MIQRINQYLAVHPVLAALVRMIEASIVGTVISYTANGFNWQATASWKGLGVAIVTGAIVAVRNWLIQSPLGGTK